MPEHQYSGRSGGLRCAAALMVGLCVPNFPILTSTAGAGPVSEQIPANQVLSPAEPMGDLSSIPNAVLLVVGPDINHEDFAAARRLSSPDPDAAGQIAAANRVLTGSPSFELKAAIRAANATLAASLGLDRCYILSADDARDLDVLADQLQSLDLVFESVEPLAIGTAADSEGHDATDAGPLPNDPLFSFQYGLENFGQTIWGVVGKPDADIDASLAWGVTRGSPSVIVAVIDSGISLSHPDLEGQLVRGYNFTSANSNDYDDQFYGHGTHIAGVIGGLLNNGIGVAGLAPQCKLMPVRVIDRFGFTAEQWVASGIIYATDQGASILNISIGFASGSQLLRSAVQYAYASGVVICASSGNIASDPIGFPARYPETIAVGATDNQDLVASFTSTGPQMTIAAPGRNIYSTWDTNTDPNTYARLSGTSFAVPYVVGTAALVRSVNPALDPGGVRSVLVRTADDIGEAGWDQASGAGRVNAFHAVRLAMTLPGAADPSCRADLNHDGGVDFADLQYFLSLFAVGSLHADLNGDGLLDFYDIQTFLILFSQGCTQTQTEPQSG